MSNLMTNVMSNMMSRGRWLLVAVLALIGLLAYGVAFKFVAEPELAGTVVEKKIVWEGQPRTFTYFLPTKLASKPALVFVFHGSGGDAAQSRAMYGYAFDTLAQDQGFIAVYPDGYERHFNGCRKAGPYAANELNIDDVGFMRFLSQWFTVEHGVSQAQIFATGVSNGGQMALRLALEAPDLVAAVAPVATSLPTSENMGCTKSGKAVAVLLMNGTDDPMNPYEGGTVALYGLLGDRGTVLSSVETAAYWAELAGYSTPPETEQLADTNSNDKSHVVVDRWLADGKPPVAHYTIVGGGHNAPHPDIRLPRVLGGTNNDILAAKEIMDFFRLAVDAQPDRAVMKNTTSLRP
ncbi:MAG: PHB depolymerase family esterase [Halioglobus sp.]